VLLALATALGIYSYVVAALILGVFAYSKVKSICLKV
jgi:hypothetical protein